MESHRGRPEIGVETDQHISFRIHEPREQRLLMPLITRQLDAAHTHVARMAGRDQVPGIVLRAVVNENYAAAGRDHAILSELF